MYATDATVQLISLTFQLSSPTHEKERSILLQDTENATQTMWPTMQSWRKPEPTGTTRTEKNIRPTNKAKTAQPTSASFIKDARVRQEEKAALYDKPTTDETECIVLAPPCVRRDQDFN